MAQWWSWTLAAIGILGIYLAGRKRAVGWLVGVAAQVLWLAYAIVTRQWGFIATAVAYAAVYGKNWVAWRREAKGAELATEVGRT
jgi:membrane protein implicated in regulation of membrane protease activity